MATSRLERIGTIFSRKQINENLLKGFLEVITQMESDYSALKENEQKLEHLTGSFLKCMQQATTAHKQKLKALKEIHSTFKKEMEGLLKQGAIKLDDRPLWFDIYKAFPPITEPKFARPPPENKTVRQILYKEDVIRAKFHDKGHGLGSNLLAPSSETQTKRLLQKYETLKSEGVAENEIIEKCVSAVSNDKQELKEESTRIAQKNPETATAQVLEEVDLKNIFKE